MKNALEKNKDKSLVSEREKSKRWAWRGRQGVAGRDQYKLCQRTRISSPQKCAVTKGFHRGEWLDHILVLVTVLWQQRIEWIEGVNRSRRDRWEAGAKSTSIIVILQMNDWVPFKIKTVFIHLCTHSTYYNDHHKVQFN